MILIMLWCGIGVGAVYYLAGLQSIPNEINESAAIDGAKKWDKFRYITLPLLMPSITIVTFLNLVGGLKIFDLPYIMGNGGGIVPSLATKVYELAFRNGTYGYSTAGGLILFIFVSRVFNVVHVFRSFLYSVVITGTTMVLAVLFASMAGYVISRSKEKLFTYIYLLFATGLIIPTQTSMIPIYKLGVRVHLINTITFLVMYYLACLCAFVALIYTGFTKNIPIEIEESAKLDGCGIYKTFFRIILPLLRPATGTVLAVTIYWIWNDFSGSLIYLNNANVQTIVMAIFEFYILKTCWVTISKYPASMTPAGNFLSKIWHCTNYSFHKKTVI